MKFILTWKDRSLPLGDEPYFLNLDRVLIRYFHTLDNIDENNPLYSSYKANDFKIVDENYREFPKNILLKIQQSGLHPYVATALLNYQKSYNTIIHTEKNIPINEIKDKIRVSSDIFLCNYDDAIFVKMTYPQVILTDITYQVSILSECKDQFRNYIEERLL